MKDTIIKKTTGMMAEALDCLSANYERFGIQLRHEVAKHLISKGGRWASFAFVFQDKQELGEVFGPHKVMLASFRSDDGLYKRFSYFNVKSKEEAQVICDVLKKVFELE